ncbi:ABC transporter ATP-binding protein [Falsarthrobacter nasiphocae]|uniref:ABC transport system ATP-binding protein n=1 Tax=Falsarthrobacter nasiphocae TaxID=189863 RepID=A0AAE4C870_9MICC|nr:ABC transporter ATP-binding protein [Falsarthrobacter nasiphocae]MDR6892105.1 putative ABC transport system ATP-binding protein [Falsarthrobacter nasiphocae]
MGETSPELQLIGVSKSYPPATRALQDVSVEIFAGESVAIVGPSGSGKSTLLAMLGLLENPDEGRRVIAGLDTDTASERELTRLRRTHISFVFQAFHLLEHLTVTENVLHALQIRGVSGGAARTAATEAIRSVGLQHRSHAKPGTLSGGERQRAAIARAVAMQPRVLLCDEPTGNLDTTTAESVLQLLLAQADAGTAVVIVTHSPELAARCDRTIRVLDGRVHHAAA